MSEKVNQRLFSILHPQSAALNYGGAVAIQGDTLLLLSNQSFGNIEASRLLDSSAMTKYILIILFVCMYARVSAQDSSRSVYRITTPLLLQDVSGYFFLTVEKVLVRKTIGISIGLRPSIRNSGTIQTVSPEGYDRYLHLNYNNPMYTSMTIDVFPKFYFGPKGKSFLMPSVYYRIWWFNSKDISFANNSNSIHYYSFNGTRTERQYIGGLRLLYGRTYKINIQGTRTKPVIEPFLGLGISYKAYVFETVEGTVDGVYRNYYKETGAGFLPTAHIGLNIGLEFRVK